MISYMISIIIIYDMNYDIISNYDIIVYIIPMISYMILTMIRSMIS